MEALYFNTSNELQTIRLSWATLFNHGNGVLEAIADDGIEVGVSQFEELVEQITQAEPPVRALLANRKNNYSFSFDAMRFAASQNVLEAVAVVSYGRTYQVVSRFFRPRFYRLAFFADIESALIWLEHKLG